GRLSPSIVVASAPPGRRRVPAPRRHAGPSTARGRLPASPVSPGVVRSVAEPPEKARPLVLAAAPAPLPRVSVPVPWWRPRGPGTAPRPGWQQVGPAAARRAPRPAEAASQETQPSTWPRRVRRQLGGPWRGLLANPSTT